MPDETLLSESTILLFGRVVEDLQLVKKPHNGAKGTIATVLKDGASTIARIYSFAYQNELVDLASPALFVVSGKGEKVTANIATLGVSKYEGTLAEGLMYWAVDRQDVTVRLDVMTGAIARILLDYELADEGLKDSVRGGSGLGVPSNLSGRNARRGRGWRSDDD